MSKTTDEDEIHSDALPVQSETSEVDKILNDDKEYQKEIAKINDEIPKDITEQPDVEKETPKNDVNNEYEYSDDKEADDKNW